MRKNQRNPRVPSEIRKQVLQQHKPNLCNSSPKSEVTQKATGYRLLHHYKTELVGSRGYVGVVRGPLLRSEWQRKQFTATSEPVTFYLSPRPGAYQEDNLFLAEPEATTLKHYQRISSVVTAEQRHWVPESPLQISGPGLGARYLRCTIQGA